MAFSKEWVPLTSRTSEVKEAIAKVIGAVNKRTKSEFKDEVVYEDYGWGQLESSFLYRALMTMQRESRLLDVAEIREMIPTQSVDTHDHPNGIFEDEGDEIELPTPDRITRSLNWFRSASHDKSIRDQARNEYEARLLSLFVEHVESTGETFYPEMQSILVNEYDFAGES